MKFSCNLDVFTFSFPLKFKLWSGKLQSVILIAKTISRHKCRGSLQVLPPFAPQRYLMLEFLVWDNNCQYKYVKKYDLSLSCFSPSSVVQWMFKYRKTWWYWIWWNFIYSAVDQRRPAVFHCCNVHIVVLVDQLCTCMPGKKLLVS